MEKTVEKLSQRVFGSVSPHVPLAIKRPVKNAIPKRYYKYIDPEWHRWSIGGMWEVLGQLQFDYLVEHGLEPHHHFLDVGCGPLRGGIHFIRYLEPGHYFGVEKDSEKLEAGRDVELPAYGLTDKRPVLRVMENFDFPSLGQKFDYALAQSVFTHLPLNNIIRCLMQMEKVLVDGGRFFATFYENKDGKFNLEDVEQKPGLVTHFDRDFFHYDFETFKWICDGTRLDVEHLGGWNNPRNQKMLVFTRV
jgi:SAM-dependent methyltransferase